MLAERLCFVVFFAHNALLLLGVWGHALEDSNCQTPLYGKAGGTIELSPGSVDEKLSTAQWKYNGSTKIADSKVNITEPRFTGRVTMDQTKYSLTVKELKTTDSGDFTFVSSVKTGQRPTYCIRLVVQEVLTRPTLSLINVTNSTNESCVVFVECSSKPDASYRWTVKNVNYSGSSLQYPLTPQEGNITFTCSVSNDVSEASENRSLNCRSSESGKAGILMAVLVITGLGCVIILSIICLVIHCRHKKTQADDELTVYAEIDEVTSNKIEKPCSLYDSVDLKYCTSKPQAQTVYDQIQFSRMNLESMK